MRKTRERPSCLINIFIFKILFILKWQRKVENISKRWTKNRSEYFSDGILKFIQLKILEFIILSGEPCISQFVSLDFCIYHSILNKQTH